MLAALQPILCILV